MAVEPFSRRTKTLQVKPLPNGEFAFSTTLLDESIGGNYEESERDFAVVHRFTIEGTISGADLRLESLEVRAEKHPFEQCPLVLPAAQQLVGLSLLSGWRRSVLDRLGRTAGCTHVTTLLLGLSDITTLVYFQRMNRLAPYGPGTRASGKWIAGGLDQGANFDEACHVLRADGDVLRQAENYRRGGASGPTT
jgi:hypothetical protein